MHARYESLSDAIILLALNRVVFKSGVHRL